MQRPKVDQQKMRTGWGGGTENRGDKSGLPRQGCFDVFLPAPRPIRRAKVGN